MQEPQPCRLTSPRRVLTKMLLLGVLFLPLESCITVHLWGGDLIEADDGRGGQEQIYSFKDADITWGNVWSRVLWTPVTLCLDCVTMPAQVFMFWIDDLDDEDDYRSMFR